MKIKKTSAVLAFCVLALGAFALEQASEPQMLLEKAKFAMETKGDLAGAIKLFEDLIQKFPQERGVAARAQYYVGLCYEKQGLAKAKEAFEKVIKHYPEQNEAVALAKDRLSALGKPGPAPAAKSDQFQMRKVWDGPDVDSLGEVSPDGNWLSTVDWDTGDQAVLEIETRKKIRLTDKGPWEKSGEFALFSVWSPDSRQVAFNWSTDAGYEIRVAGLEGSKPRTVYQIEGSAGYVQAGDWSPDGKSLLIYNGREGGGEWHLGLLTLADGSARRLKSLGKTYPSEMCFSPDGRFVIYDLPTWSEPQESNIFILALDGSLDAPLLASPADEFLVGWTPDGRSVLFTSDQSGTFDLWAVRVANGKAQGERELVKKEFGVVSAMGFTASGSLFYGANTSFTDLYIATIDPVTAKLISPPVRALPRVMGSKLHPDWSPDGKSLAYVPQVSSGLEMTRQKTFNIVSLETGKTESYPVDLRSIGRLIWSPDGRSMLLRGLPKDGYWSLYLFDLQTRALKPLVQSAAGSAISSLATVDARDVYYIFYDFPKKARKLLRYNFESQSAAEVYKEEAKARGVTDFAIAPDGKSIAYVDQTTSLKIMPVGGGEAREILKLQSPERIDSITWTNDGKGIVYSKVLSKNAVDQTCELWLQRLDGGAPRNLGISMDRISTLRFHPDGKQLLFRAGQARMEVWALENFLPGGKR
ncbi:MAG: tetratricopeptide repeat protein [Candidatus Aminicenantes bacterium]|nr:tetratricopeptide repeat protein [Candidatus Aminicenantes bacterium]